MKKQKSKRIGKHVKDMTPMEVGYIIGKLQVIDRVIASSKYRESIKNEPKLGDFGAILGTIHSKEIETSLVEFSVVHHPTAGKSRRVSIQLPSIMRFEVGNPEPVPVYPICIIDIDTGCLGVGYTSSDDLIAKGPESYHSKTLDIVYSA